jgi:hypothetical protein
LHIMRLLMFSIAISKFMPLDHEFTLLRSSRFSMAALTCGRK